MAKKISKIPWSDPTAATKLKLKFWLRTYQLNHAVTKARLNLLEEPLDNKDSTQLIVLITHNK